MITQQRKKGPNNQESVNAMLAHGGMMPYGMGMPGMPSYPMMMNGFVPRTSTFFCSFRSLAVLCLFVLTDLDPLYLTPFSAPYSSHGCHEPRNDDEAGHDVQPHDEQPGRSITNEARAR